MALSFQYQGCFLVFTKRICLEVDKGVRTSWLIGGCFFIFEPLGCYSQYLLPITQLAISENQVILDR